MASVPVEVKGDMETMMNESPAWVRLWVDRLVAATADWTVEEYGAYVRLLVRQAIQGELPSDVGRLARIAGMDRTTFEGLWVSVLRHKFEADPDDPGRLRNARMASEREHALGLTNTNHQRAKKAAKARWKQCSKQSPKQSPKQSVGECSPGSGSGSGSGSSGSGGESERGPLEKALLNLAFMGKPVSETVAGLLRRRYDHCAESKQLPMPGESGWRDIAQTWRNNPEGLARAVPYSVQHASLNDPQNRNGTAKTRDERSEANIQASLRRLANLKPGQDTFKQLFQPEDPDAR